MQTPNLVTGQIVKQPETDLIMAAIRSLARLILDLLLKQQPALVPGGFALSAAAGTPIVVNYAQGVVILSGYDIAVPAGSLTIGAANATFHRYDLLTIAYSQTFPTDSAGQATTLDTATPTVVPGTASATPVLPALPAGSVTIGWIDVPPGVTSAQQCVLHQAAADLGPLVPNDLADLTAHLLASALTATVHGIRVDAAGGTTPGRVPQLDAMGAVQRVQTIVDAAGVSHPVAQSGANSLGYVPVLDSQGRVPDSQKLGGFPPSSYQPAGSYDAGGAAAAVQSNLGAHTGASLLGGGANVHGVTVVQGQGTFVGNGSDQETGVSFGHTFAGAPKVKAWLLWDKTSGSPPLWTITNIGVENGSVTASGFTLGATGALNGHTFTFGWEAIGG